MKRFAPNKALLLFVLFQFCFLQYVKAQTSTPNYSLVDNLNPVTPTVYQFSKYTDLPVSEYTGIPNISIPLYEIDEDGVKIPLDLTYHSSGFKVNEEASWVGLGWDLTIGSIVQQINDQDDYAAATFIQPDFYNTEGLDLFPLKMQWADPPSGSGDLICETGCNAPLEVPALTVAGGANIYTGEYAPYNGDYGLHLPQDYLHFFDNHAVAFPGYSVDSEPDVFTVNFLGYSFKFIRDPVYPANVIVLDKQGFKVTKTTQGWVVMVPSGEEYDFTTEDVVNSSSSSTAITNAQTISLVVPSSNVWMLNRIVTKNKKVITFNYTQTAPQNCYPTFTQRGVTVTLQSTYQTSNTAAWQSFFQTSDVTTLFPGSGVYTNQSSSNEKYTYLSSITFPNGTINFNLSARNDIQGGLKLDSLSISTIQKVKSYKFNYSYFDATLVGGKRFNFGTSFGNCPLYRLKLSSLQDNSGANYNFTYNSTQLPAKNSFAVDYWGYYNGDTTNMTLVPNAAQFNMTGWPVNTDNHSPRVSFTEAGILQQIQYPTGGTVNFAYELNQFNNYFTPDFSSSSNTVSSGNGLRIQSITWNDANSNQLQKPTILIVLGWLLYR